MIKRLTKEQLSSYRKLQERDLRYGMRSVVGFTLTPFDDYWEDVEYYGEGFKDPTESAIKVNWVYVLVNPSVPGIVKIGFTTTSVWQRLKEINSGTGTIVPWYSMYSYKCPNGRMLEQDVHTYLEDRGVRVSKNKEGFFITSDEAIRVIEGLGKKYNTNGY